MRDVSLQKNRPLFCGGSAVAEHVATFHHLRAAKACGAVLLLDREIRLIS